MRLFFFLFFSLQALCATDVRHGTLENGLTYYVQENSTPKDRAVLMLAVKVGSLYEKPHEVGIAHFIEHLNFRGSKHFEDGALENYLESLGDMRRNANTGFERTVYYLDIPLTNPESLDQTLLFLRDFAGFATLEDKVIQKERHVVLDELHHGFSSTREQVVVKFMGESFPGSLLPNFPSGTLENITNVSPDTLRSFYKKWYRPDRMAVIIVGDLECEKVEKKIKNLFGPLSNPEEKVKEPDLAVVFPEVDREVIYMEPELDQSGLALMFAAPYEPCVWNSPEEWIKESLISECAASLFGDYLKNLKGSRLGYFGRARLLSVDRYVAEFSLNDEDVEREINSLLKGIKSLNQKGFTAHRLEEWIEGEKERLEKLLKKPMKRDHSDIADQFVAHFTTYQGPLLSEEEEHNLTLTALDDLTLEEVNRWLELSPLNMPYTAFLFTPKSDIYESLKDKNFLKLGQHSIQELEDDAGYIDEIDVEDHSGVSEWTLSNGIKVLLKNTELGDEKVVFHMVAKGGLAQYSAVDFPSGSYAVFGLKDLAQVGAKIDLNLGHRSIQYEMEKKEVEPFLHAVYNLFKDPKFKVDALRKQLYFAKWEEKQKKTAKEEFKQKINDALTERHYTFQKTDLEKVDPEKAKEIFNNLFGCPQDFTFILVGDFDLEEMVDPINRYIGSLPERRMESEEAIPALPLIPTTSQELEYVKGKQTFATCHLEFLFDLQKIYSQYHSFIPARSVCQLLEKRLWNVLRSGHGKTYGVRARLDTPCAPYLEVSSLVVEFTCQPHDRQLLTGLVFEEIKALKEEGITTRELSNLKAFFHEEQREGQEENGYWVGKLTSSALYSSPLSTLFDPKRVDKLITLDNLRETALQIFAHPNHCIFYHLPEKHP